MQIKASRIRHVVGLVTIVAGAVLLATVAAMTDDFNWWFLIPVFAVGLFFLIGFLKELIMPLTVRFAADEVVVRRGSRAFRIPADEIEAVGVTGSVRYYHLTLWLPDEQRAETQELVKFAHSRPPSTEAGTVMIPLVQCRNVNSRPVSRLREYIDTKTRFAWQNPRS